MDKLLGNWESSVYTLYVINVHRNWSSDINIHFNRSGFCGLLVAFTAWIFFFEGSTRDRKWLKFEFNILFNPIFFAFFFLWCITSPRYRIAKFHFARIVIPKIASWFNQKIICIMNLPAPLQIIPFHPHIDPSSVLTIDLKTVELFKGKGIQIVDLQLLSGHE